MIGCHQRISQYKTHLLGLGMVIVFLVGVLSVHNVAAQSTVVVQDSVLSANHQIGASQQVVLGPNLVIKGAAQVTVTSPKVAVVGPMTVLRNATVQVVSGAPATSVEEQTAPLPERFTVLANYPNPFNPETRLRFALPQPMRVEAVVYDVSGRRVKTLLTGFLRAGWHAVVWDGTNALGQRVGSGLYFYAIRAESEIVTGKMTLLQ